jgi:hypothetical protein
VDGPSYLPRSWREAAVWLSMVFLGAFGGRFLMVFVYHATKVK